jgi:hypothetical protein
MKPALTVEFRTVNDEPGYEAEGFTVDVEEQPYRFEGLFRIGDSGIEIVQLQVTLKSFAAGGIDSKALRSFPIGAIREELRAMFQDDAGQLPRTYPPGKYGLAPRPGRRGHPEEHYRWVAERYIALARQGRSRGIRALIAKEAEERSGLPVAENTVGDWIHRARNLGFLAPGMRGRVVSEPGPRLAE